MARRVHTLVTAYSLDECERRVDGARVPTSPFHLERADDGELILGNASWNQQPSIYEMRVRFTRQSFGTQIDVTTQVSPAVVRRMTGWWIVTAVLAVSSLNGSSFLPVPVSGFGPLAFSGFAQIPGPIALAVLPILYLNRRARGTALAGEKVATLERVLSAGPAATSA
jgi:hypothetical protein